MNITVFSMNSYKNSSSFNSCSNTEESAGNKSLLLTGGAISENSSVILQINKTTRIALEFTYLVLLSNDIMNLQKNNDACLK